MWGLMSHAWLEVLELVQRAQLQPPGAIQCSLAPMLLRACEPSPQWTWHVTPEYSLRGQLSLFRLLLVMWLVVTEPRGFRQEAEEFAVRADLATGRVQQTASC